MDLAMGEESSHCEGTPSTWTFSRHDLPIQFEAAHSTLGINRYLLHWFWWFRHNDAQVVFTLGAGAVEVFGHGRGILSPLLGAVNRGIYWVMV